MTAYIARMSTRQKKIARHTLDVVTIALILLGLWLASGVHTMTPHQTHTSVSDTINV